MLVESKQGNVQKLVSYSQRFGVLPFIKSCRVFSVGGIKIFLLAITGLVHLRSSSFCFDKNSVH